MYHPSVPLVSNNTLLSKFVERETTSLNENERASDVTDGYIFQEKQGFTTDNDDNTIEYCLTTQKGKLKDSNLKRNKISEQ